MENRETAPPPGPLADTAAPHGLPRLDAALSGRARARSIRWRYALLPLVLFVATCLSTFWTGAAGWKPALYMGSLSEARAVVSANWGQGLVYTAAVLGILLTHEMGHFLMAVRYRIPASLPFFIPVPVLPFGTMGAVIGMEGSRADRRQMFDLGIAGPLAGLIVALPVSWLGIWQLPVATQAQDLEICLHNPLLYRMLIGALRPDYGEPAFLFLSQANPFLVAGWVGMLVTGLNMLPVSQLDGGHVTYAVFGRAAHFLARTLLVGAILFVLVTEQYHWVLMIVLVTLLGTDHPPTADDGASIGRFRVVLGCASLAIPILCLPPGISIVGM